MQPRLTAVAPPSTDFAREQIALARFNRTRLAPGLGEPTTASDLEAEARGRLLEAAFVERVRRAVSPRLAAAPTEAAAFMDWFDGLRETGPGQGDPLFPWLGASADLAQMRWFLFQEVAGEAGFDDLVALTQIKMPARPKLEMARNYWDEMGRGKESGMHGPMLDRLAEHFDIRPDIEDVVPEALAVGNLLTALATNRRFAFHAAGALGAVELTAPTRACHVADGLKRLGVPTVARHYFALHAAIDIKHSLDWNREVIEPLVSEDPRRARAIAEGALMRLECGARSFARYRRDLGLSQPTLRLAG